MNTDLFELLLNDVIVCSVKTDAFVFDLNKEEKPKELLDFNSSNYLLMSISVLKKIL